VSPAVGVVLVGRVERGVDGVYHVAEAARVLGGAIQAGRDGGDAVHDRGMVALSEQRADLLEGEGRVAQGQGPEQANAHRVHGDLAGLGDLALTPGRLELGEGHAVGVGDGLADAAGLGELGALEAPHRPLAGNAGALVVRTRRGRRRYVNSYHQ